LPTFGAAGVLTGDTITRGVVIGGALMFGSIVARHVVERIGHHACEALIDIVLAVGAATMIVAIVR
jgi:uncharacterized protein